MGEDKVFEFSKLKNCLIFFFCDVDVYSFATLGEGDKLYSEGEWLSQSEVSVRNIDQ